LLVAEKLVEDRNPPASLHDALGFAQALSWLWHDRQHEVQHNRVERPRIEP
jgi:hypothetical protein